jgi:hypothetical protein
MENGQSLQCREATHALQDQLLRNSEPSEPSYLQSHFTRKEERRELPTRRSLVQGTTKKRLGIPMECARESGLIDENPQSDWRMIV